METTIRKATEGDINAIEKLNGMIADYHAAIDSLYSGGETVNETFREYLITDLKKENSLNLVAESADNIIGWFSGNVIENPPYLTEKIVGHIGSAYVLPEYRSKGITKAAIAKFMEWFKEKGATIVELSVDSRNEEGIRAWKGLGFAEYRKKMKMNL